MRSVTNLYFDNHSFVPEQELLHDLIIESISIYGIDMIYLPREIVKFDKLYGADDQSKFTKAIQLVFYLESFDAFRGDGSLFSKFNLEIRDQISLITSQRVFSEEVGDQIRPNEGDLIYFPLNQKLFQVRYVNKHDIFYQLGTLPTWKLTLELFEYSNEIIETGYEEIDKLYNDYSTNIIDWALTDESNNYLTDESGNVLVMETYDIETIVPAADNDTIQEGTDNYTEGSDDILDWSENDPFSESGRY